MNVMEKMIVIHQADETHRWQQIPNCHKTEVTAR